MGQHGVEPADLLAAGIVDEVVPELGGADEGLCGRVGEAVGRAMAGLGGRARSGQPS